MDSADTGTDASAGEPPAEEHLTCSARGCQADAVWALRWNNPKLHTPERRKTWLACDAHRESLSAFLGARGFLREVEPLAGGAGAGGEGDPGGES